MIPDIQDVGDVTCTAIAESSQQSDNIFTLPSIILGKFLLKLFMLIIIKLGEMQMKHRP